MEGTIKMGDDPRDRKESSETIDPDKQRRRNGAG
jgi:hypothetical protein